MVRLVTIHYIASRTIFKQMHRNEYNNTNWFHNHNNQIYYNSFYSSLQTS